MERDAARGTGDDAPPPGGRPGAPVSRTARAWSLLARRDPGWHLTLRGVRSAVAAPVSLALAFWLLGTPGGELFAGFGSLSLCLFVDFGGPRRVQARSYVLLVAAGVVLLAVGTLCSRDPATAVVTTAVVGFVVLFAGLLGPQVAMASTAVLLTFILPVTEAAPASAIAGRVEGYLLGAAVCVPAALFVWPRRAHDPLRNLLATAARRMADLVALQADGRSDTAVLAAASRALDDVRVAFNATPYPPTGAGPNDVALTKVVARLQWAMSHVAASSTRGMPEDVAAIVGDLGRGAARTLAAVADVIGASANGRTPPPVVVAALVAAVRTLHERRQRAFDAFVAAARDHVRRDRGGGPDAPDGRGTALLDLVDPTFHARMLGFGTEMVAAVAAQASGASEAVPDPSMEVAGRPPGHPVPPSPLTDRATWRAPVGVVRSRLSTHSVWLQNALRGGVGLAAAVTVVEVTAVSHGFWVVLGTISVLRSSAAGTGTTAVRAVLGTVVGVALASLALVGIGGHTAALWIVFPVTVFIAAVVPNVFSFVAGQAGFTLAVLIMFNIVIPLGWTVGLVRIGDVLIGCAVSFVVGLSLWPRGATAQLGRSLCVAFASSTDYLRSAVVGLGFTADGPVDTVRACDAATAAYHQLDDACRMYLSERGEKSLPLDCVTVLVTGANQVRIAAHLLALLGDQTAGAGDGAAGGARRSLEAASEAVVDACDEVHRWYQRLADYLDKRVDTIDDPPPAGDRIPEATARALQDALETGNVAEVRTAVRLLWAREDLHEQRALQVRLASAAHFFVSRKRHRLAL
jgi:uncharacterized membrane protein YccC